MPAGEDIQQAPILLASGSRARAAMLQAAGLAVDVRPVDVDEAALRARLSGHEPAVIAMALAEAKAKAALAQHAPLREAFVIAADQLLVFGGRILEKQPDKAKAVALLAQLRGRTHELVTAAVLARDGEIIWRGAARATIRMRNFSDEVLRWYAERAGAALTSSVGCYEIEGPGIQLMEEISGDLFTIRGLPLLALLDALREHGALAR
ncbi:MAG: septum formation inhibitor Maf [Alphaproteobacteria bacterium]|nr:MAG: septum formation inhibitor Maf [Alphaproteobacteria bacterium]